MRVSLPWLSLLVATSTVNATANTPTSSGPFLTSLNAGNSTTGWIIGNNLWNITIGEIYGTKLFFKGQDLIGDAVGHYSGYDGENNLVWTSASVYQETSEFLDVVFTSTEADLHWVIYPELAGAYQYIVNKALPTLGVLRTLYRLDNATFTHGRTNIKDDVLPPFSEFLAATKVQDETWQRADGSYITKYDFSTFIRPLDFHGIYGDDFGSWYIRPGKDYHNGNHLKQELTVHRESKTGDAVELNVVHGSHFQVSSKADFPAGKIWGPWLWYLNNGSKEDASSRAQQEFASWPYAWLNDTAYQSRGSVSGKLLLSNGLPASGAAVFLGDSYSNTSTLDQGAEYYYTSYADADGNFNFEDVRSADYGLYAWSNGGDLANISTTFKLDNILVQDSADTALGDLSWEVESRERLFQIGDLDHKATGFRNGGAPYQHASVAESPANLTYTVGVSNSSDWYFGQSALGSWTVLFDISAEQASQNKTAILGVSLAGYSKGADLAISVNGQQISTLTSDDLLNDPSLYRSGTTAGEWRYYEFDVAAGVLKEGTNNVVFQITAFTLWRGFLWDSIFLDWSS